MAELDPQLVGLALERLADIERVLAQLSQWADGESARREWAAISLEDAAAAVAAAGWRLSQAGEPERADPARLAALIHRRMTPRTEP